MWLIISLMAVTTAFFMTNKRYRWFYIFMKTYKRDYRIITGFLKLIITLWWYQKRNYTVARFFNQLVKLHPNKKAVHFEESSMTFQQASEYSNQVANYFKEEGFVEGDCVALLLENKGEYPYIWLGLSKIGVVTALINTNLVNDPLLHSFKVAKCKAVIYGSNHCEAIDNVANKLNLKLYQFHEGYSKKAILPEAIDLNTKLKTASVTEPKELETSCKKPIVYIYTSGTTGLPKAAVISHIRFIYMVSAFFFMSRIKKDDIIYNPLPLYHTAGGMIGVGQMLLYGITIVVRKKFSASNYWSDCEKYNCTVAQYVGEICRYLLAAPRKQPLNHSVRAVFGNGLKAQIWKEFVETFKIKEVFEFYGATEGISNIMNLDNTPGSIGFIPRYAGVVYPMVLIKCDLLSGEPLRNNNGFCVKCNINEPGLVITKINPNVAYQQFKGYADEKATDAKILYNVFVNGDQYFNSGDILRKDEFGYFYFIDRTGDTFRWKGENVSTSEVEGIISNAIQLNDAVVYGVEIPNTEGRAGMAAIVDINGSLDLDVLATSLNENLPSYAIPIFLRIVSSVPMTGTFKLKKTELLIDGFDIEKIHDDIYFYNTKGRKYVKLTKDLYSNILSGKISF